MLPKKTGKLTIQMDEMWYYVGSKANKKWILLAIDISDRSIVVAHIGVGGGWWRQLYR